MGYKTKFAHFMHSIHFEGIITKNVYIYMYIYIFRLNFKIATDSEHSDFSPKEIIFQKRTPLCLIVCFLLVFCWASPSPPKKKERGVGAPQGLKVTYVSSVLSWSRFCSQNHFLLICSPTFLAVCSYCGAKEIQPLAADMSLRMNSPSIIPLERQTLHNQLQLQSGGFQKHQNGTFM